MRLTGKGNGADDTLLHTPTHLMRIVLNAPLRGRYPDLLQGIDGSLHQLLGTALVVDLERFDQLVANGKHRIQGGLGVLEDHRDTPPPYLSHLVLALVEQVLPLQQDFALHDTRRWLWY